MSIPPLLAPLGGAIDLLAQGLQRWQLPSWLRDEFDQRLVLLLNHVLQQEPQAMQRVARLQGQRVCLQWQHHRVQWLLTPAGLLDVVTEDERPPDLRIELMNQRPSEVLHALVQGEKPTVSIHGDVRLAAEVNWLIDHVSWDIEADVAKVLGDATAYRLGQLAKAVSQAVQRFLSATAQNTNPMNSTPRETS